MKNIINNIIDWYRYDFGVALTICGIQILFIIYVLLGIPFGWTQVI